LLADPHIDQLRIGRDAIKFALAASRTKKRALLLQLNATESTLQFQQRSQHGSTTPASSVLAGPTAQYDYTGY